MIHSDQMIPRRCGEGDRIIHTDAEWTSPGRRRWVLCLLPIVSLTYVVSPREPISPMGTVSVVVWEMKGREMNTMEVT